MFSAFYRQAVRIMRLKASSADGSGAVVYEEVLNAAGAPLPLKCKLEEIAGRAVTLQAAEETRDATMLYKVGTAPDVRLQDVVVTAEGRRFRVNRIESNRALGSRAVHARASLSRVVVDVPEVKALGE